MKTKKNNRKLAKALAVAMFAVGFVTPVMFSNIAEAANYGKGGTTALYSDAQLNTFSAKNSSCEADGWDTWAHNITDANCVMINGYRFKVVKTEAGTGTYAGKQILTLWSYNSTQTGATKFFATDIQYNSSGSWGSSAAEAYNNSDLKTAMDGLLTIDSTTGKPNGGELYDSNLTYVKYTSTTDSNVTDAYVWAPSKTEVESTAWGDGTNALSNDNRALGYVSWLRSPNPDNNDYAYFVYSYGNFLDNNVDNDVFLLRPALQILNQTSYAFTTNSDLSTLSTMNGGFTADADTTGSDISYALNSSAAKPTFTPTSGVTLDGTKIGITVTDVPSSYSAAGLLTTNSGTTWNAINTGENANIAYMAQVDGSELDLQNVDAGTDYNLKIFGLKTADTTVTQLADNAVQGLSVVGTGVNAKVHMKIGGTYNNGVPVTLKGDAVADLAGDANNPIIVDEASDTGKLNLGTSNYKHSGDITDKGTLIVEGTGTLAGTVSEAGKIVIDGTVSADADIFEHSGGLEVKKNLVFTSSGLNVTDVGGFTQASGSNVTVPASKIQADINDPNQAMFTGVDAAGKLNVSNGNLTLSGVVYEDKYYVLAKGTAVGGAVTASDLWKTENIDFSGVLLAEYDTNAAGGSIALKMTKVATFEEGSTSGLAAVQQGNISVAKEFTDEVANRLSFVQRPSLLQKMQAKVRDVANTNKDDYKVETVEQGNANEVMPVQVADEDKYDKEVWASYIRTKETTEGMKLGAGLEGNNTAQYNGAVVGVDFYSSDKAIAGVAFSYTTGDIDSYSGETATRNKSKYYGISFYDRVTNGNNAIIYDIGFIEGDNDISQFYTGEETTADVKTDTYTAGVRYEAEFGTKESRVVPFASFRYMRQNNKDYTNSHGTRFESSNQNLYIPKVGIAWTGDFTAPNSVCTWRPHVEAGYVWNLGDRSVDSNVLMGTTIAGVEYDTVDKSSYYAKAGMEFSCKNFTAGLFYRYLKGSAVCNNKWNVNVAWSF